MALDERQMIDQTVSRFKNPIIKLHPKIYVVKQDCGQKIKSKVY